MTMSQMLGQSGILTLLGLGGVFSFLIILILSMKLLHVVLHALRLDKDEPLQTASSGSVSANVSAPAAPAADNGAVIAAIAAALHEKQFV